MIREELKQLTNELIENETKSIVEKYGKGYHSDHEFYAVLKEEIEEAQEEVSKLQIILDSIWTLIKKNNDATIKVLNDGLLNITNNTIYELAQVGAVIERYQKGEKEKCLKK